MPDGRRYVGRVGTGFDDRTLRRLDELPSPLGQELPPLADVPESDASDARQVRPELVGEVEYAAITPDGRLRHARWRGLCPDKSAAEVGGEN